ncbi:MAG TPA: uracil-DNA glycosylase family protein, partial [Acidimicrobiales bacterium]|nr:uracil-DNA glycosylase family protein [Acidimicrobiales bacterium]
PESVGLEDGLELENVFITSPVKCVPPANKPNQKERNKCRPFFERELSALANVKVIVALGQIGYMSAAVEFGLNPKPKFSHGLEVAIDSNRKLLCSYHVSQQNTFTGRLTESMFDTVIKQAKIIAGD